MLVAVIALIVVQAVRAVPGPLIISAALNTSWSLGCGFELIRASDSLTISNSNSTNIWSSVLGQPFIGASAGNDSVTGSDGAFQIQFVDMNLCEGQSIEQVQPVSWKDSATGSGVQVRGSLLDCGGSDAAYTATFWVPLNLQDRVAFRIDVESPTQLEQPLRKLYFRYASNSGEDFYGLGAQPSFASLKSHSIPIFSREQGVGRGDAIITEYENENGTFAGGDKFTTYTAIPSYVSTDGNVFYLAVNCTAFANFDFTENNAVTIRYEYLSVEGQLTRASNMFDAVEMLTAYTGRMPSLPTWVDDGAILGIQGGQVKVNKIVEQGLALDCPIAGVWLQDWCGTRTCIARTSLPLKR